MDLESQITRLEEKDYFYLWIKKDGNMFEGKFEKSELRNLIEIIDNCI